MRRSAQVTTLPVGNTASTMVTMRDIAAQVGVSQATVSYVLNGRKSGVPVREEMRERILKTATELGYRRNDLARAMASGKNYVLGFVTRIPGQESSNRIMVGAQEEATKNGYMIKLVSMADTLDYQAAFARMAEQRFAGVLALNLKVEGVDSLRDETRRFDIPVALLDDPPPQDWATTVVCDDSDGLRQAIEHLRQLGHRRIAFISGQRSSSMAEQRRQSFLDHMARLGLSVPPEYLIATDWIKPDIMEQGARELLAPGRPRNAYPTAIVCAGDLIAMVAQRTARALGYQVPQDLSVVGFADFLFAAFADPPLTTIAQAYEEMGRLGVQQILQQNSAISPPSTILVPTHLVVRASTGPVPTDLS
jgi:LacI family transcriptional regulator